ncbi:ABC transporter ATP-binding protein [Leptospira interrogans]
MTLSKLEVRAVSKNYTARDGRQVPVLEDLSLNVANLEFMSLLGPSGCGKSTLLRIIDGLVTCNSGAILLDGKDVTGTTGDGKAMVFQSFDLFPWRTAIGNVEFGLEVLGMPAKERHDVAHHYIDLVGLGAFADSYPHQLSGGMQQRVGIARALAIRPEILLMDEPFGALDVQTREILQDELLRIWQQDSKTVVFVTHGIEEALYLSDRIVVFSQRPARILRIVDVPFGRPRDEAIKSSPEFQQLRREIWEILKTGQGH